MGKGDGSVGLPSTGAAASTNGRSANGQPESIITWEQRDRADERNSLLLDRDLREKRLVFESRPYEAHVQFSNFCNMSCIMCWNGKNPPLRKMSPDLLERLGSEVAPDLTFITPHDGSEPTVVTWEETVALTKQNSVRLWLTTNGQEFDEEKFHQIEDVLDLLVVSVDSHLPEVFERIRPGAKADKVYRNLETVARLSEERGIQCMVTVVFMTVNAPLMADTVAWMADRGVSLISVTQMIDSNRESWQLDATMHFSAEYLDWIKKQCIAVAEDRKIALDWYLSGHEVFDFREPHRMVPGTVRDRHFERDERRKLLHPGFCAWAYHRLKVKVDGQVSPCGLDTARELDLGTLGEQSFDEIWNGKAARDLRRGHYTSDYPNLCKSCRFVDPPSPQEMLPVLARYLERWGRDPADVVPELAVEEPVHMLRAESAPLFALREPPEEVSSFRLVLSPGGQIEDTQVLSLEPVECADGVTELSMPAAAWSRLETNIGYWWTVVGMGTGGEQPPILRTPELRCLIRHEHLPRIEGSGLKYPDEGNFPMLYLGGDRQVGWSERGELPHRPPLRHRPPAPPGRRFASRRNEVEPGSTRVQVTPEAYREMVNRVRDVVSSAVPEGAVALVAAKGDDSLRDVRGRELRHFPADAEGNYVGHDPVDDSWAIERIHRARAAGAEFLVIPAWMRWWLDHYRGLAEHLGEPIVDDRDQCTIFDLRRLADLPGGEPTLEELADRTLGYGGHHRMAFRRFHRGEGDDPFPRFAVDAYGYHLVDAEGRKFIDWVSGGGPVILGYRHPAVTEAITAQLPVGPTLTLTHPVEVEVAELLTAMVPCAERVAFGKNGSDALTAAVRLARAATGRELILQYGGHGFHDWYVARFGVPGVPRALGSLVRSFPYNDLDALEALFEEHDGEVAAVVMEPLNIELPKPGYLEGVRELTSRHGALLVFDEVITSFRIARGGAQERYGVVPDLACLGKAMANGMPLSAVVGKRVYMERLPEVAYGMTFRGETLSLAAARAVLRTLRENPVAEQLAQVGAEVRAAFERACAGAGIQAALLGPEARMTFAFGEQSAVPHERLEAAFVLECARRQILTNGNILPSLAHDQEALRQTEAAFGPALEVAKALTTAGTAAVGQAIGAGFARCAIDPGDGSGPPAGFLDAVRDEGATLMVRGWLLADEGGPLTIELTSPGGATRIADRAERPDVAAVYPGIPGALHAGFAAILPPEEFVTDGRWDFTIRASRGDETLFMGRVTRPRFTYGGVDLTPSRLAEDGILHL